MRLLLLLAVTCLALPTAHAIEHHSIAVGGGLNLNNPNLEDNSDADELVSATFALGARELLKINDQWLFRTGLWLQQKSARFEFDDSFFIGDISYTTIYASVPLTAQYQIKKNIGVFGGYIADIRLNDYCDGSGVFDENCQILKESKSVVHLATIGGSVELNKRVDVNISYQHGLTDVVEDGFKLNTLSIMAFVKFN